MMSSPRGHSRRFNSRGRTSRFTRDIGGEAIRTLLARLRGWLTRWQYREFAIQRHEEGDGGDDGPRRFPPLRWR